MESPPPDVSISKRVRQPIRKIKSLLKAKDDTSRFVGLTLLKETLETNPELQNDKVELACLWQCISPRFLDRLLLTGMGITSDQNHARHMLDFAVGAIHTFTSLQPKYAIGTAYFERIPRLSAALHYSSPETAQGIIEIILALVQEPRTTKVHRGAIFVAKLDVDVWTPLIAATPNHPDVFNIFRWIWLKGTAGLEDQNERNEMRNKIDFGLQSFVSSSNRQPPADLLVFVMDILRELEPDLIPPNPQWLESVVKLIKNLSVSKQSEEERCAYTNCAGTLLQVYPNQAPQLLFSDDPASSKPLAYLLITMLQVDFHSTVHRLLPMTGEPEYPKVSNRLASALEVVTSFLGYLVGTIDIEDRSEPAKTSENMRVALSPEHILKIRIDVARTIAEAMEYLRDRWDAIFLATRGCDAQAIAASQDPRGQGPEKLAWDVTKYDFFEDPITSATICLSAIWLRDDDGVELRRQGAGLMDIFVEIYQKCMSGRSENPKLPDLRLPILAALEGVLQTRQGIEVADVHSLWSFLSSDLRNILEDSAKQKPLTTLDYMRGSFVCNMLQTILNNETSTRLSWLPVADTVAMYQVPPMDPDAGDELVKAILEFQMDVLQVAVNLLRKVTPVLRSINEKTVESLKHVAAEIAGQWEASENETLRAVKEEVSSL
ncbi:Neurochondrin-domain-containing protein [Biscogniauxia sp. FL1348]|nr:Neurochondrin-domain-containing protein [Biscogniauxia sp. FL1348]